MSIHISVATFVVVDGYWQFNKYDKLYVSKLASKPTPSASVPHTTSDSFSAQAAEGHCAREMLAMKMLWEEVEIYMCEDLHLIDEGETSEAQAIAMFEWWKVHEYQFFLTEYLSSICRVMLISSPSSAAWLSTTCQFRAHLSHVNGPSLMQVQDGTVTARSSDSSQMCCIKEVLAWWFSNGSTKTGASVNVARSCEKFQVYPICAKKKFRTSSALNHWFTFRFSSEEHCWTGPRSGPLRRCLNWT